MGSILYQGRGDVVAVVTSAGGVYCTRMTKARLLIFASGALSVALALVHFSTRSGLGESSRLLADYDLVGLSMLYAGLVTMTVAWMALSRQLLSGYAVLYGVYCAGQAWVLLFSGMPNWLRAGGAIIMAAAALVGAYMAWIDPATEDTTSEL
jgi:hypothetical protein